MKGLLFLSWVGVRRKFFQNLMGSNTADPTQNVRAFVCNVIFERSVWRRSAESAGRLPEVEHRQIECRGVSRVE